MNALKDRKILITIAVTVVVALILYFVGISTVNSKVTANNTKKASLEASNSSLLTQISSEKAAASNKSFIISKLTQFQAAVPQQIHLGSITNQLNALCSAANINWVGDSVGAPAAATASSAPASSAATSSLIYSVPLTFTVNGSWTSIENTFIPGLYIAPAQPPQQVSRLIVITGYSIDLGTMAQTTFKPTGSTSVTFQSVVYIAPTITPVAG